MSKQPKKAEGAERKNPRFVMVVGSIREVYPDIPEYVGENGQLVIWDRQEGIAAVIVSQKYSQALCLETVCPHCHDAGCSESSAPFTALEDWLNGVENRYWRSEDMTPTRKEFRS